MEGDSINVYEHKLRVDLTKFIKKHNFTFDMVEDEVGLPTQTRQPNRMVAAVVF